MRAYGLGPERMFLSCVLARRLGSRPRRETSSHVERRITTPRCRGALARPSLALDGREGVRLLAALLGAAALGADALGAEARDALRALRDSEDALHRSVSVAAGLVLDSGDDPAGLAAACFLLPSADLLQRLEPP